MRIRLLHIVILLFLIMCGTLSAQVPDSYRQRRETAMDSMRRVREQYEEDYWRRFRLFEAERRPMRDKPQYQPVIDTTTDTSHQELRIELQAPLSDTAKNVTGTMTDYTHGLLRDIYVPFYGLSITFKVPEKLNAIEAVSQTLAGQLVERQKSLQLNDWGLYQLSKQAAVAAFPKDEKSRTSLVVSVMNLLHYDVRMGRFAKGHLPLVRTNCTVYGLPYIAIGGNRYYADGDLAGNDGNVYCDDIKSTAKVYPLDMRLMQTPLLGGHPLSFKTKQTGVNSGLIDFFASYPSVDIRIPASAAVGSGLMKKIRNGFIPSINTEKQVDALNLMLSFCQTAFNYRQDMEQFGTERYFFCEENFAYPANDCEDRAILFAHMVREYLGLDIVLLDYLDHVATAVCLTKAPSKGHYITIDARRYYICDPTFRGARVGQLDKRFHNKKAKVILTQ